jgi:glutathione S-transferase
MYTLFWETVSGAMAPQAMMEEMGIPYEKIAVDMAADEHRTEGYLAQNPTGQVPALKFDGGRVMGESAAIVLFLGEQHPEGKLVPLPGDQERPTFLFWLMYMATSGYMTFGRSCHPERHTTDQDSLDPVRLAAEAQVDRFFETLEGAVAGDPYFLQSGFSALDIYLTMLTTWHADKTALFDNNPKIAKLCAAVEARPAYQRVMHDHNLSPQTAQRLETMSAQGHLRKAAYAV